MKYNKKNRIVEYINITLYSSSKLMKRLFFILIAIPLYAMSHPGIGIVKDSKGNIYYTDLERVWKISNGKKTVIVPNMHTHELWIDKNDNLFGENLVYMDQGTNRFDHFLWMLSPAGKLDTVVARTRAYVKTDYSLNRDGEGNEFYVKQFGEKDLGHIYWKKAGGNEEKFARADLKDVHWLYPLRDGSVIYVSNNNIYKARKNDTARILAQNIGRPDPTFSFMKSPVIYGMWDDEAGNIYVAVYSDQSIRKISADGKVTDVYRSAEHWGPNHGVFDNAGKLWVLETSDKNEVRVTEAGAPVTLPPKPEENKKISAWLFISAGITVLIILVLLIVLKRRQQRISA
jgi:hypothetical protein